jgi:Rps23 Pro-64 3,4-dihydroxylase Tpa1-like proline 4-hydroxylase
MADKPTKPPSLPMPPFASFPELLPAEEHDALLGWILSNEDALRASTLAGGRLDPQARTSRSLPRSFNGDWQEALRTRIAELFPQILRATGIKAFALAEVDLKLVAYGDGDFFAPHVDTLVGARRGATDRVVTAIYYLHRRPRAYSGGALRLFPLGSAAGPEDTFVEIEPRDNCLIAFPSWAMHGVAPVACPSGRFEDSRFAINCWLNRAAL